jgi:enoyl-CoA hydratase
MTEVSYSTLEGVASITLSAPSRRNALTPVMADELIDGLRRAERDRHVGAIVVSAEGPDFCSGADLDTLRDYMRAPMQDAAYDGLDRIYEVFRVFRGSPLPVVAAVAGRAVGAGVNVAMMCDVRLVADDVELIGFGAAGVHPGGGHLAMLLGVSPQVAAAVALFDHRIHAQDAVTLGIALKSVPRDDLMRHALALAAGAARDPSLSRRITWTYRAAAGGADRAATGILIERAPQIWSLNRRFGDASFDT